MEQYLNVINIDDYKPNFNLRKIEKLLRSQALVWNNQFISNKNLNKLGSKNNIPMNTENSFTAYYKREQDLLMKNNQILNDSLANGLSRKIIDFYYLYKITNNMNFKRKAMASLSEMLTRKVISKQFELGLPNNTYQLGLFNGLAGVGVALLYILSKHSLHF